LKFQISHFLFKNRKELKSFHNDQRINLKAQYKFVRQFNMFNFTR